MNTTENPHSEASQPVPYEPPTVLAEFTRDDLAAYLPEGLMPHLHAIQNS